IGLENRDDHQHADETERETLRDVPDEAESFHERARVVLQVVDEVLRRTLVDVVGADTEDDEPRNDEDELADTGLQQLRRQSRILFTARLAAAAGEPERGV